jgi:hypothetical protein
MRQHLNKGRKRGPKLVDRLFLRLSTGEQLDGLWVGAFTSKPEHILHRVRQALCLIKTHDQRRYNRLIRDLKRVWVMSHYPIACFDARLSACMLNAGYVVAETTTPELLASVIVHEATHARLWGCGIGYEEELRPRVEAACLRRELAFSAKLPDGQQVRNRVLLALASCCNQVTLSNSALAKLRDGSIVEEMRRLGVSDWGVRLLWVSAKTVGPIIHPVLWARRGLRIVMRMTKKRPATRQS